jgi:pyruvate,water dikinase
MIGKLSRAGVEVPGGFATTAVAYREFLAQDGFDAEVYSKLRTLNVEDVDALNRCGTEIRAAVRAKPLPAALTDAITAAWKRLAGGEDISVAVRS